MAQAQAMLDTFPGEVDIDSRQLADTIEALVGCAITCTQCADACLSETSVADMTRCIRLDLDCADICQAASRVLSRQTSYDVEVTRAVLEACITVCGRCADECGGHARHMEHCRICSETCRHCEQACRSMLDAVGR